MIDRHKKHRNILQTPISSCTPWNQDAQIVNQQQQVPTYRRQLIQSFLCRVIDHKSLKNKFKKVKTEQSDKFNHVNYQCKYKGQNVHNIYYRKNRKMLNLPQIQSIKTQNIKIVKNCKQQLSLYPQVEESSLISKNQQKKAQNKYQTKNKFKSASEPKYAYEYSSLSVQKQKNKRKQQYEKIIENNSQIQQIFVNHKFIGYPVIKHLKNKNPEKACKQQKQKIRNRRKVGNISRKVVNASCIERIQETKSQFLVKIQEIKNNKYDKRYSIYYEQ